MNRVDRELRNRFKLLIQALKVVNTDREEISYEALNRRILQEVTDKPILARIITSRAGAGAGESLLLVACSKLNLDTSHDVIKSLIQKYPPALITSEHTLPPIFLIARHLEHFVLMPWIATNYHWVLDHSRGQRVVFDLLDMYSQRRRNSCASTIIKDFFEAYPQALTLQDSDDGNILHYFLKSYNRDGLECDADLFKWMAERCPSSAMMETNSNRCTPLHLACNLLSRYKGRDSGEICKYLIDECPGSVEMTARFELLPIHNLQNQCDYRVIREVVVCLVREYPESLDISRPYGGRPPSSFPFIQSIKPLLDEEIELKETAASLKESYRL